jgi:hypothetical protein
MKYMLVMRATDEAYASMANTDFKAVGAVWRDRIRPDRRRARPAMPCRRNISQRDQLGAHRRPL